ncbi:MAG: MAPEG family protein [Pseudomonadota bacterium]
MDPDLAQLTFLLPVLALVLWTSVMWFWLYITRVPAMQKARIHPQTARHPDSGWKDKLPATARGVADNYNHLHEQPVLFYAVMAFAALTGGGDTIALGLAWAYVALRVVHSFIQAVVGTVMLRFNVFALASLVLTALVLKEVVRAFLSLSG